MERSTYELAAGIYRELRQRGTTIRNSVDCMIAAVVLEQGVHLLHADRDFEFIHERFPLRMI
jgi:predicted nucleic acid-binding protein